MSKKTSGQAHKRRANETPEAQFVKKLVRWKKLFWQARASLREAGASATESLPKYVQALDAARKDHITGASELLEASLLERKGQHADALALLDSVSGQLHFELQGHWLFTRANALRKLKQVDEALSGYQLAIELPGFDRSDYAYLNVGVTFLAKDDPYAAIDPFRCAMDSDDQDLVALCIVNLGICSYTLNNVDEAISYYKGALEKLKLVGRGHAYYNLGIAYMAKGEVGLAIDAYQKAIKSPGFDETASAWNNLGSAYARIEDYEQAIACFSTALGIDGYESPNTTRCNLAWALQKRGRLKEALAEVLDVLSRPDTERQHSRARFMKSLLEKEMSTDTLRPAEAQQLEPPTAQATKRADTPEARMLGKVKNAKESQYDKYLSLPTSRADFQLCTLRGWSSSVTLLEGNSG